MPQFVTMHLDGPAAAGPAQGRATGWHRRNGRFGSIGGPGGPTDATGTDEAPRDGGLAETLARRTSDDVVLLHDRGVPDRDGRIDHLAVASSGVWIVAVDGSAGRVERRELGTWRAADRRLLVGGCDRTTLVAELAWKVDAVRTVIAPLGIDVALHPVLCFTRSSWGVFAAPFRVGGVLVADPRALATAVSADGVLITAEARAIAHELDRRLPPA